MPCPRPAAKTAKKPPKKAAKSRKLTPTQAEAERTRKRAGMKAAYDAKSVADRAMWRWRKLARPPVPRQGSTRGLIKRNANLARAYCDWSDIEAVVGMYLASAVMSELTGQEYVVDHQVPLVHPLVCGLHTHTNLEVLSARVNRLKSNLFWPEMWAYDAAALELLQAAADLREQDRLEAASA